MKSPIPFELRARSRAQTAAATLLDDPHLIVLHCELEDGDPLVVHELRRDRTAHQVRKLLGAASYVLLDLNDRQLVGPALCLDGNHVLDPMPIGMTPVQAFDWITDRLEALSATLTWT